MDTRRLSTGDILSMGIVNQPAPKTDVPEDRNDVRWDVEGGTREQFIEAIEDTANVVDCPEYYGIPIAWKEGEGYRAILLQYRAVTHDETFASVDDVADWFIDTAHSVAG